MGIVCVDTLWISISIFTALKNFQNWSTLVINSHLRYQQPTIKKNWSSHVRWDYKLQVEIVFNQIDAFFDTTQLNGETKASENDIITIFSLQLCCYDWRSRASLKINLKIYNFTA